MQVKTKPITSYIQAWDEIHGPEGFAAEADIWFKKNFPDGHETSLKPFAEMMLSEIKAKGYIEPPSVVPSKRDSCVFHPKALELLLEYGVDYAPDIKKIKFFRELGKEPKLGGCFGNSWQLMEVVNSGSNGDDLRKIVYAEGLVWGLFTVPALHAWNSYSLSDTRAADWTQYIGCQWNRYLGIAFTETEFDCLRNIVFPNEPRRPISVFDLHYFPFFEEKIIQILASRAAPIAS